jgi:hypothetical protein
MSCWPGSAPERTALRSSDARVPVDTQNATRARSRCEGSRANSSLNTVRDLPRDPAGHPRPERPDFCLGNGSSGLWCACARSLPDHRERVHDRPGPRLQVIPVEAPADRLGVRHRRRRVLRRRRPFPRHRRARDPQAPGLVGELEVPTEVAGLDPGRLVPRDAHGPREPEPAQQRQRVRPLRRCRTARRL